MFFDRFGQTIVRRLHTRDNGLRRFIMDSFVGLLDALGLTKVYNMGTLGVNRSLTSIHVGKDYSYGNKNVQATTTRHYRVIVSIGPLRTYRGGSIILYGLYLGTVYFCVFGTNKAMGQVDIRTHLPTRGESGKVTGLFGDRYGR